MPVHLVQYLPPDTDRSNSRSGPLDRPEKDDASSVWDASGDAHSISFGFTIAIIRIDIGAAARCVYHQDMSRRWFE